MSRNLGVIGFGLMGSEIALLGAMAGWEVHAVARNVEKMEPVVARLGKVLRMLSRDEKHFAREQLATDEGRQAIIDRIHLHTELSSLSGCDYVIESAPEVLELKHAIFSELAGICREDCILATNTSSFGITQIAAATNCQERVIGMHFFNPPTAMALVEVIPGLNSSEDTTSRTEELAQQMGKTSIRVQETPGFVVNRILTAMMNEAMNLYEEGAASIEDIDTAMKLGAGFPLGPFRLADLVGLDTYEHTCDSIYRETGRQHFKTPRTVKQYVKGGRLGRKNRHGFHKY
ncbi:3-hydroxyacyl-CoA dehydrogenase family protein [bacterium]|nr:3-hydroxyacyl-CoA dehydrogenase family protein [bacterium]